VRTRFERERALRESIGAAGECLRLDELCQEPLNWLSRAMDISGILLYRFDASGVKGRGGNLVGALPGYSAALFEEDPVQRALLKLDRPPPILNPNRLDGLTDQIFRRSAAYNEFYKQHDMENLLGTGLTQLRYGLPGMTGMLFSRSKHEQPFGQDEFNTIVSALPSFQAAIRRSDRLARELGSAQTQSSPAANGSSCEQSLAALAAKFRLTAAEAEVLALIAEGLSNREIAQRRFVSLETVRTHVQRVFGKLDVGSRTQAALCVERARVQLV
jgi:DNA-binding CsgD family transcriptional regulator